MNGPKIIRVEILDRGAFSNENTPKIHLASILCPVESAFLLTIVSITSIMMLLFQLSPLLCAVLCCAWWLSHVWLFGTPWTVAPQSPLSIGIPQARILEWVAMPSSRGSSQPRDQTQVSCIADRFFTIWATRKDKNTGVGSYSFSRASSWPRNGTRVSCIAGRFFTSWATREALRYPNHQQPRLFQSILISLSLPLFCFSF